MAIPLELTFVCLLLGYLINFETKCLSTVQLVNLPIQMFEKLSPKKYQKSTKKGNKDTRKEKQRKSGKAARWQNLLPPSQLPPVMAEF